MDNEMIERVAKALWDHEQNDEYRKYSISNEILFGEEYKNKAVPWELLTNIEVVHIYFANEYRKRAKAAIKAMREPTDKMIIAALDDYDKRKSGQLVKHVWQSMIDAITND